MYQELQLVVLAYYGLFMMCWLGIAGLLTAAYHWYENKNALDLSPGYVVMSDFADKKF